MPGAGRDLLDPCASLHGIHFSPAAHTVSQNSRTGCRLALTDVRRSGTELVRSATDSTAPVVAVRFAWMARKWKITRISPTAVTPIMTAEVVSVVWAADRIGRHLLRLAQ